MVQVPANPISHSTALGRRIRTDDLATLGTSTQSLFEAAVADRRWDLADNLAVYYHDEILRIRDALVVWLDDILDVGVAGFGAGRHEAAASWLLRGLRTFDPASGDLTTARGALERRDAALALRACEQLRLRWVALHDTYVAWIQDLLTGIAERDGEDAILEVLKRTYERLWKIRYARWDDLAPIERLQLSVEGMRGHLSGARRRGDVGIIEEHDRFVMVLDPCGSCGVLRQGDPESGRPPCDPEGNRTPHQWTWGRTGVGWYAVHSPIVMEYLPLLRGEPPLRPHLDCDLPDRPCRWFVYKDRAQTRPQHAERLVTPVP